MSTISASSPPGWLERTFLYTFGLSGLILLIHSGNVWVQGPQVLVVSAPRPWYGRPSRPTTARPRVVGEQNVDMGTHGKLMAARVETMRRVCRDTKSEISSPRRVGAEQTLMWDSEHHLVYCPIYKVASGTWTTNFLRLSSFNSDMPKWQRFSKQHNASESTARKMFPPPKGKRKQRDELARSTKFLVVRHPFDRIISAYKGKIAKPNAKPRFYRTLQKEIKSKYSNSQKEIETGVPPTFEEYWRYLIDLTNGLVTPRDWRVVDCVRAFYSVCVPCDVEYDVILKLETHDDDTEFLIRKYNLTELQEQFTMWKHKSSGENQLGDYDYYLYEDPRRNPIRMADKLSESKEQSAAREDERRGKEEKEEYKHSLIGQLTREQVKALYRNYKTDFDMFGYDTQEFLRYAQLGEEGDKGDGEYDDGEEKDEEEDEEEDDEEEKVEVEEYETEEEETEEDNDDDYSEEESKSEHFEKQKEKKNLGGRKANSRLHPTRT